LSFASTAVITAAVCLMAVPLGRRDAVAADQIVTPASAAATAPTARPAVVPEGPPTSRPAVSRLNVSIAEAAGISPDVLRLAVTAVACGVSRGDLAPPPTLTVIDYSRPSLEPRLWVFDTRTGELLFKELVAHGRNSGDDLATRFSDAVNSHQTSIGMFVARDTYVGSNGYSLRLDGLEPGFNGRARERAIVMHGAPYVNAATGAKQGRLGRSWGCPAVREAIARDVIDTVRNGGVIFSYYPDAEWLRTSRFLTGCTDAAGLAADTAPAVAADGSVLLN
jgi:hypothetical protein